MHNKKTIVKVKKILLTAKEKYATKFLLKLILLISLTLSIENNAVAQHKKYEFRSVWVSTVVNIDWPSQKGLSAERQQEEIIQILDRHKENNINAIILQVRPAADAIYSSEVEPWTVYLSGTQGQAPEPFYDPLEFWIREAHSRGMELHAWFNPYRIKQNINDSLAENHIFNQHPEWGWKYGNRYYFEPGNPQVWHFVTSVVADVVQRYDIDAVHFDDYFYPYQINNEAIPDSAAFKEYGGKYYPDNLNNWRRNNVDTIIQILSTTIKEIKPYVKFGISPFGVWRNMNVDPRGSETSAGTSNYDMLYADVIKWQQLGWIDYIMPQIYWREDHPAADFSTLALWWNDYHYGRSVYVGLAPYRIDRKSEHKQWKKHKSLLAQIEFIRSLQHIDGFGFFSSRHFFRNDLKKLNKKIRNRYCKYPAIVPPMPWIDNTAPLAPENLRIENNLLIWDAPNETGSMETGRFFVIYKYSEKEKKYLKKTENIIEITGDAWYSITSGKPGDIYRVSALDRLNNESQLSNPVQVKK